MHLVTQPSFRGNPEAITDQQHPVQQLWVYRWAARVAVVALRGVGANLTHRGIDQFWGACDPRARGR